MLFDGIDMLHSIL